MFAKLVLGNALCTIKDDKRQEKSGTATSLVLGSLDCGERNACSSILYFILLL